MTRAVQEVATFNKKSEALFHVIMSFLLHTSSQVYADEVGNETIFWPMILQNA